MGDDIKNNTLPFMDGQYNIYQFGIVMGYIISKSQITKHTVKEDTYWLGFNIQTRKRDQTPTILACVVEGDMAYEFDKIFEKGDQVVLYTETYSIYEPTLNHSTNRTKVLGWTSFRDIAGINPPSTPDEEKFIARCLEIYHEGAPIPSDELIYKAKALLNQWKKDKWKKGK